MHTRGFFIFLIIIILLIGLAYHRRQAGLRSPAPGVTSTPSGADTSPRPDGSGSGFSLAAGDHDFSFRHQDYERSYILHVPSSYDSARAMPLVLNFHGGGGSADGHEKLTKMSEVADREGFIVAYPRGMRVDGDPDRPLQRFWNPGTGPNGPYNADQLINSRDDISFTATMLDDIESKFNVDKKRIYATGFSNGAMLTHLLGCRWSNRLAAIAPVGAPFWHTPSSCNPTRPVSVMYFHGRQDACAPYEGGTSGCEAGISNQGRIFPSVADTIKIWREKNSCSATPKVTYQKGTATCETYSCREGSEVVLCSISDGGHTWPGGTPYRLPGFDIGKTTTDISASQAMWEFFKRHPLGD